MNFTHPTYKIMKGFLDDSLKTGNKLNILDYGCGSGYLLTVIPSGKINRYWGLETSPSAVKSAKVSFNNLEKRRFLLIDPTKPLIFSQRNLDVVIAIGVLQYMDDRQIEEFIDQSSKALKKGGHLMISCVSDHNIYRYINFYGLALPNRFVNRIWLTKLIKNKTFRIVNNFEKGVIFGPLFYHNLVIVFDVLDKIIFQTKGTLGFFGKLSRKIAYYIADLEYLLPVDFGYTLYINAVKK